MLATLKNISRAPVTVILDHPAFANAKSGWRKTVAKFGTSTTDGARNVNEVRRALVGSITLMPGQSAELHPAIAKCSQVPQLIAANVVTVTAGENT